MTKLATLALALVSSCNLFGSTEMGGIHARLGYSEASGLRVADVPEGPALEAGLEPDDRITRIDGDDVRDMSMQEIVERLRGPVDTTVEIEVVRDGEFETFHVRRTAYERNPQAGRDDGRR